MGTLNPLHSELFANYLYIIYFKIMIFQKIVISQNSNASSSGLEEATKPPMGQWELWSSPRVVLGVFYLYNWPILCENSFFSVKSSMIESSIFQKLFGEKFRVTPVNGSRASNPIKPPCQWALWMNSQILKSQNWNSFSTRVAPK